MNSLETFWSGPRARRWLGWLGILGAIGYAIFLTAYFAPVAGGADSSGYMNSARLFTRGRLKTELRVVPEVKVLSPFHFLPQGFVPVRQPGSTQIVPTYPTGLPLQLAAAVRVFGWKIGPYVTWVGGALLAVVLCYALAREFGIAPGLAILGAATLAISPMFLFIAVQSLSDVLATTWACLAIYSARRASRSWLWALGSGAACGVAVLVRPTNLLILPAVVWFLANYRLLGWLIAGGLPMAAWVAFYQHSLYNDALRSGYGDIFSSFESANFAPTISHYLTWLPRELSPPLLVFAFASLLLWRTQWRVMAGLILWAGPILMFYAYYDVTKETWWCLRFILPAFPPIILAALLGMKAVGEKFASPDYRRAFSAVMAALWIWSLHAEWKWDKQIDALAPARFEIAYEKAGVWIRDNLPADALVTCMNAAGAVYYYTDFPVLRWDTESAEEFHDYVAKVEQAHRPFYALFADAEQKEEFDKNSAGKWKLIKQIDGWGVWKWE